MNQGEISAGGIIIGGMIGQRGIKGDKGDKGDTGSTGNGISSITKTGTSGLVDTYTITYTNGDTFTYNITNGEDGNITDVTLNGTSVVTGGTAVLTNIEITTNKVTTISGSSTDTQYPSAKCVYDLVGNIESILEELDIGNGVD